MGRFETEWLSSDENLASLTDLSRQWIDCVHGRRSPRSIVLDVDSSVCPCSKFRPSMGSVFR